MVSEKRKVIQKEKNKNGDADGDVQARRSYVLKRKGFSGFRPGKTPIVTEFKSNYPSY